MAVVVIPVIATVLVIMRLCVTGVLMFMSVFVFVFMLMNDFFVLMLVGMFVFVLVLSFHSVLLLKIYGLTGRPSATTFQGYSIALVEFAHLSSESTWSPSV